MGASYICPSFGNGGFTRGRTYNTTVAYQPGILSTSICIGEPEGFYQGFSALYLTQLQQSTRYNGTCVGLDTSMESTTNVPQLSLLQDLTNLDSAWSTCNAVLWGAFDPPIALHKATAVVPDPGGKSPPTPAPGSPVAPPYAPATPTAPPMDLGKPAALSPAPEGDPQGPESQTLHPPDPVNSSVNGPNSDPQDPNKQKPDPPDSVQPSASRESDDPAASAFTPTPLNSNGGNVAQESPTVVSNPESNDPQPNDETSEGDPGAASSPIGNLDQSPADNAESLPSIGGHQVQAANGGGIIIASTTLQPGVQTTMDGTPISVDKDRIVVASSTIPLAPLPADPIITLVNGDIISASGKAATASGTTVALAPHDNALVVNGNTTPIPPLPTAILTIAGQIFTAAPLASQSEARASCLRGRQSRTPEAFSLRLRAAMHLSSMAGPRQFLCRLYRFSKSGPRPSPLLLPLAL